MSSYHSSSYHILRANLVFKVKVMKVLVTQAHLNLCDPWTAVACQAPLSMEFSRQEYWTGLPFPSPGDLPNPGVELGSPALQALSLPSEAPGNLVFGPSQIY